MFTVCGGYLGFIKLTERKEQNFPRASFLHWGLLLEQDWLFKLGFAVVKESKPLLYNTRNVCLVATQR